MMITVTKANTQLAVAALPVLCFTWNVSSWTHTGRRSKGKRPVGHLAVRGLACNSTQVVQLQTPCSEMLPSDTQWDPRSMQPLLGGSGAKHCFPSLVRAHVSTSAWDTICKPMCLAAGSRLTSPKSGHTSDGVSEYNWQVWGFLSWSSLVARKTVVNLTIGGSWI